MISSNSPGLSVSSPLFASTTSPRSASRFELLTLVQALHRPAPYLLRASEWLAVLKERIRVPLPAVLRSVFGPQRRSFQASQPLS